MGLMGKRVAQIDTKCNGDVLYELFRYKQKDFPNLTPNHIQSCELNEGKSGAVGSILTWNFLVDGKVEACKLVLESADEKKKSVTYASFGGDLMQIYKSFKETIRVEPKDGNSLVIWTVEYEKVNEDVPDPDSFIDLAYKITKDIEARLP